MWERGKPISQPEGNDPLNDLDRKLREAREPEKKRRVSVRPAGSDNRASSMAFRVGSELVSALLVGVGIGWLLDEWLGTKPWLMVVFFFLGSAAGIYNVYRAVNGMSMTPGMGRTSDPDNDDGSSS